MKTKTVRELEAQHDAVHALDMPEHDKIDTLEGIEGEMVEAYANEQQLERLSSMDGRDIASLYTDPEAFDTLLGEIREAATSFDFDVTTAKGRTICRSIARKVSSAKVRLDEAGKKQTLEWARKKAAVDASRKKARDYCDNLRDEIKAPAVEWDARVAAEKAAVEAELQFIRDHTEALERNDLYDREARVRAYEEQIAADKLAKEEAERLERLQAEAKIKAEADAAAAIEAEREHARQAVLAAEKAAEEAVKKAEEDAKWAIEAAAIAAAEDKKQREQSERLIAQDKAARAADKAHRNAVNVKIIDTLVSAGIEFDTANKLLTLIASGMVPHLKINY